MGKLLKRGGGGRHKGRKNFGKKRENQNRGRRWGVGKMFLSLANGGSEGGNYEITTREEPQHWRQIRKAEVKRGKESFSFGS